VSASNGDGFGPQPVSVTLIMARFVRENLQPV